MAEPIKEMWVAEWPDGYYHALRDCRPGFAGNAETFRRFVPEPVWTLYDPEKPPADGWYICEIVGPHVGCPLAICQFVGGRWWRYQEPALDVRRYTPVPRPPEWIEGTQSAP